MNPTIRQFTDTIPRKGQSQEDFDQNVDDYFSWQAERFAVDLQAFGVWAEARIADIVAENLPPLNGREGMGVKVNAAGDGLEFFTIPDRVPVGQHVWMVGARPDGYLTMDGAFVSRTLYADLFAYVGTNYGAGDGSTTFKLPDLVTQNRFIRAAGGALTVGTPQQDQMQRITGFIRSDSTLDGIASVAEGAFTIEGSSARRSGDGSGSNKQQVSFDSGRVTRTGDQTQPRSIAFRPCIKF